MLLRTTAIAFFTEIDRENYYFQIKLIIRVFFPWLKCTGSWDFFPSSIWMSKCCLSCCPSDVLLIRALCNRFSLDSYIELFCLTCIYINFNKTHIILPVLNLCWVCPTWNDVDCLKLPWWHFADWGAFWSEILVIIYCKMLKFWHWRHP